ncbi:MAG: polyketide synthase dehydratase domain-containing protein, partial [Candidatus Aminicenantes bacterium]|nr:polyketide synthase dehydratase domain-containing protein [Candidatus Aminicenantes bacterium]
GMGLTFASELAKDRQARLVLTDRPGFPGEAEWDQWLDAHKDIPGDPASLKIQHLRQMQQHGAELLVCPADAAEPEEMRVVIEQARERFGTINGVIHTAGLADGGLIQVRGRQQSQAVLAPKIAGTLILSDLLKSLELDFFLLCSSLSSELASAGQVAYCAANSFLDAFAFYHTAAAGTFTLAVNWDSWQEVGMAVTAVEQLAGAKPVAHPLIDLYIREGAARHLYISRFYAGRFWVLDGHRILGKATLPGTAYLEMAGAAFTHHSGSDKFEISDLMLLAPLSLDEDEQKTIHTVLEEEEKGFAFSIRSRAEGRGDTWQEHARGRIAALSDEKTVSSSFNLEEIKARLETQVVPKPEKRAAEFARKEYLKVGPRWNNAVSQILAVEEGLAELELPEDFISDLKDYRLHPALLDTATAFLVGSYPLTEPMLPFLFKRVRVSGALPRRIFSYSRAKPNPTEGDSVRKNLAFNIIITDEQGHPVVEVEEFTLITVSPGVVGRQAVIEEKSVDPLQEGIRPKEGVEIFYRLLSGSPPRVLVSTTDLPGRLRLSRLEEKKAAMATATLVESGEPAHPRPEISSDYAAPENKTQEKLAAIWQQVLGIGNIGIDDDFFELGGDSLKGLTVISEIQKTFNVELSITDFFTTPTVRGLAEWAAGGKESIYASIAPVEEREYYPLSSAQKRLYFLQQLQPESVFYNIPNILIVEGSIDESRIRAFEDAFRALIRRQESLRTTFHLIDGQPAQKIHDPGEVTFALSLRREEGEETTGSESRIIERFVRPFDLTRPPLMRVELVKLESKKHLWLFDIHHIVSDATGLAILHKNLFTLINGEELSPLRAGYRDFSHWQNALFDSGIIDRQRDYWLNVFSGGVPEMRLPSDYPRPEVATFAGDMHLFRLPPEKTSRFLEAGTAAGATLFMNLVAVLNVLLFKYTGIGDIVIGSSIAGRPHADLQDIVGMFVNMLAIRNYPDPEIPYVHFLQKVKTVTLAAFENQDLQFEMLIDELNLAGDTSRNPLFDVCINVQNYEQPGFAVEGLTFRYGGFRYKNAKFDMLLWAGQAGDELKFMLEYSTELFKPETAQQFADHLLQIMDQVGRNKEIRLVDVGLSYRVVNPTIKTPEIDFDF